MKKILGLFLVLVIAAVAISLALSGNESKTESYYSADDFYAVKKVDGHVHIGSDHPGLVEQAVRDNFILLGIVTEVPGYPPIDDQENDCLVLNDAAYF